MLGIRTAHAGCGDGARGCRGAGGRASPRLCQSKYGVHSAEKTVCIVGSRPAAACGAPIAQANRANATTRDGEYMTRLLACLYSNVFLPACRHDGARAGALLRERGRRRQLTGKVYRNFPDDMQNVVTVLPRSASRCGVRILVLRSLDCWATLRRSLEALASHGAQRQELPSAYAFRANSIQRAAQF